MQELAEKLSELGRLPRSHMIRRCAPLPPWLTDVADEAATTGRPWFHVYLDNFCAMEKLGPGEQPEHGFRFHEALEDAWRSAGVLSSEKKKVAGETRANELGACLDGETGTLGPSAERILRLQRNRVIENLVSNNENQVREGGCLKIDECLLEPKCNEALH